MDFKSIFLILLVLVCLSLSMVSATDLNNTQVIETSSIPVDVQNKTFQSNDCPDTHFLDELQEKINKAPTGSVLDILEDYDDYSSTGIIINKDLTIDGHGHIIDRLNLNGNAIIHSTSGNIVLKNLVIRNSHNDKSYKGGALFIEGTAKYTIENCTFSNNWADDYGAAIYNDGENSLTIKNSYFKSNIVDDDDGGAIFSKASVDIEKSTFEFNSANDYGGAIYCDGNVNVYSSLFRFNKAINDDGGAIFSNGNVTISKSKFEKNIADDYGGAIYANSITINSQEDSGSFTSSFIGNEAGDDDGGALYSKNGMVIVNSVFDSNKAKVDGGAIYAKGNVVLKYCLFENNKAEGASSQCYGGAIRANDISVDNSTFRKNHAADYGGAIYAHNILINQNIKTCNSYFLDNDVNDDKGGAIYAESNVDVNFAIFRNNTANVDGGAIYSCDNINVIKSIFENNKAEGASVRCFGGAIRAEDDATIDNSTFSSNVAENHGGAIYANNVYLSNKNFFLGNTATKGQGGAIWTEKFSNEVYYATFMDNKAGVGYSDDGGAIYINSENSVTFSKCIFINNHCGDEGGAIYLDSRSSHLTLKNNCFMGNIADDEGQNVFNSGFYDNIEKNWWGGLNPSSVNDKLIEWKVVGSNVGHSDSNILLPIMITMVTYDDEPIIKIQEFFYTSEGEFVNDDIFDLNQITISSSLDAQIIRKEIVNNGLIVDLKPAQSGKYTITSDFYGYKITQEVTIN